MRRETESAPETWVVTGDASPKREGLFPDEPSRRHHFAEYMGSYPTSLKVVVMVGHEEDLVQKVFRVNAGGSRPIFTRVSSQEDEGLVRDFQGQPLLDAADRAAYRAYYDEGVAADPTRAFVPGPPLGGHGGPLLVLDYRGVARWEQGRWRRESAPWQHERGGVRLTNGASLVLASRSNKDQSVTHLELYWISAAGEIHAVPIGPSNATLRHVLEVGNAVWLHAEAAEGSILLAPVSPAEVSVP